MGYKHDSEDILKTGMELFRTNGYHKVGINQILEECGIPKGSFYNFFQSKEDFAISIVKKYGQDSLHMIQQFLREKSLSPLERLKSFYTMLIDSNETDDYAGGCLINTLSNEVGRNVDSLAIASNESFKMWVKEIALCVKEGQELGEITNAYSDLELAEYMHAGLYGSFSRMKVTRSREYMDKWFKMTFSFITA